MRMCFILRVMSNFLRNNILTNNRSKSNIYVLIMEIYYKISLCNNYGKYISLFEIIFAYNYFLD